MLPDDVSRIVEWLTEKVDALSTKLKPELKDEEEVGPGCRCFGRRMIFGPSSVAYRVPEGMCATATPFAGGGGEHG